MENETGNKAYIVKSGKVEIVRNANSPNEIFLGISGPGELVGEMAILQEEVRTSSIRAIEDTCTLEISGEDFEKLVNENGEIGLQFLKILSHRTRQAGDYRLEQRLRMIKVEREVEVLKNARTRIDKFDDQALEIFNDTINQAKRGFSISLVMSGTIFIIGIILLVVSIVILMRSNSTLVQQLFGIGGSMAGLGSILAMFYKGPLERIERSVTNLVQTEIAFLGYIRQVTQVSAMFEREYLSSEEFNIVQLKKILGYIENIVKETMPLVNQYTAVSTNKAVPDKVKTND